MIFTYFEHSMENSLVKKYVNSKLSGSVAPPTVTELGKGYHDKQVSNIYLNCSLKNNKKVQGVTTDYQNPWGDSSHQQKQQYGAQYQKL